MTTTTYYNLNIVEGTDIVNPLIVDNPNYEKIDEAMHNSAVAGVTLATEIANATVHAITRENSDCAVIRFIATSQWKAGDTATVDGVPVTALLPSGETLPDGAYVINANVLCVLTGTNLTVYVGKSATDANEIAFNDTTVGAELVKLDGEIVRLDGKIDNVNSNLEWKILGRFKLNETLTLPDNWKELYFISSKTETAMNGICGVICNLGLTNNAYKLSFNGHIESNNGQALSFMVSTKSITFNQYTDNGTLTLTNGICDIYYR